MMRVFSGLILVFCFVVNSYGISEISEATPTPTCVPSKSIIIKKPVLIDIGSEATVTAMKSCADGSFIFTGSSDKMQTAAHDILAVKASQTGKVLWKKYLGEQHMDKGYDIAETPDGYAIAGTVGDYAVIIMLDYDGKIKWTYKLDKGTRRSIFRSLAVNEKGEITAVGSAKFENELWDYMYAAKFDAQGNRIKGNVFYPPYGSSSEAYKIRYIGDGSYRVSGDAGEHGVIFTMGEDLSPRDSVHVKSDFRTAALRINLVKQQKDEVFRGFSMPETPLPAIYTDFTQEQSGVYFASFYREENSGFGSQYNETIIHAFTGMRAEQGFRTDTVCRNSLLNFEIKNIELMSKSKVFYIADYYRTSLVGSGDRSSYLVAVNAALESYEAFVVNAGENTMLHLLTSAGESKLAVLGSFVSGVEKVNEHYSRPVRSHFLYFVE